MGSEADSVVVNNIKQSLGLESKNGLYTYTMQFMMQKVIENNNMTANTFTSAITQIKAINNVYIVHIPVGLQVII